MASKRATSGPELNEPPPGTGVGQPEQTAPPAVDNSRTQHAAVAEILHIIAASPTQLQPVLEAIAESVMRQIDCLSSVLVTRYDGELLHFGATRGARPDTEHYVRGSYPVRPTNETAAGRCILERVPVNIADARAEPSPRLRELARTRGFRAVLVVPMLSEGQPVGAIWVSRREAGKFPEAEVALLRTYADQAAIAIRNAQLHAEAKETLERQSATSEVLQVISSSMADAAPVFDKILDSCEHLFSASMFSLLLVNEEGQLDLERLRVTELGRAKLGADKAAAIQASAGSIYPMPLHQTTAELAFRDAKVMEFRDALNDRAMPASGKLAAERMGHNYSALVAPLMWEGRGIGILVVMRLELGSFPLKEHALLKTFADQAVIAIQNARMFNETKEALERQTATAEILKVISESPTDVQPVFDAIAQSAARLFGTWGAAVLTREADQIELRAIVSKLPHEETARIKSMWPRPFDTQSSLTAKVIADAKCLEVPDTEVAGVPPSARDMARAGGYRALVFMPLLREGQGFGGIVLNNRSPNSCLSENELALLRTFADQAVIAIENVRLFKELQNRTEALTQSVRQLTALGEVGQAISSTLDLDEVLPTIVARAVQLTGLDGGAIYEFDEQRSTFHLRGGENVVPELVEHYRSQPVRLGEGAVGGAAAKRAPVQIADILAQGYESRARGVLERAGARGVLERAGARALLAVPLLSEGRILGALAVVRNQPGEFAPDVVKLLETFATQSAIAIQNARLFREVEEKSRELEVASQHKSQFLASMSHELRTPLNAILGFNEMVLDGIYGEIPEDVRSPLQNIQASGQHLLGLINNVLDLAKIEAGRMELALTDYSVLDVVTSVGATLRPLAAEKRLRFVSRVPDDLPPVHGDAGRISQCLLNLAGNSIKFTKQGEVAISVECEGERMLFEVVDTGIGIPPDKIDSLFGEFKQTDATIASEYGGSGLGLSITKKFVELHGGRIWAESELGKGSTFKFEIPLRAAV